MKKILMTLSVMAVMTSMAFADVAIEWMGYWGGYNNTVANPLTGTSSSDSIRAGNSVIWQLVWAGNDGAQAANMFNAGSGYVSGNDQVLATRTMAAGTGLITAPEDSTQWDEWLYKDVQVGSRIYINSSWGFGEGYVYQRVFQGTPTYGSWYYTSGLLAVDTGINLSNPGSQQVFYTETGYLGWNNSSPENRGYKPLDQFAVPEPATMSLLGLGALVMAIRRRRS